MGKYVKGLARRSKTAIILYKIFDNWRLNRRVNSGSIETTHGSTHANINVADSVAYVEKQFRDYLDYAEITADYHRGCKILELGPGDNLGVALKFLAAGANTVVALDRFYSKRDPAHQKKIYSALAARLNPEERVRFDEAISSGGEFDPKKLQSIYGQALEEVADRLSREHGSFDLIVSCAVLEEIYDPASTFAAMDQLLASGGYLVHKIDLSDYGMFRNQGMHPLTFLTIPEYVYKRMASHSGLPNRKRLGYYYSLMKDFNYDTKIFVTSTITRGRLEPAEAYVRGIAGEDEPDRRLGNQIRGKLAAEFQQAEYDELLIDGMLLVARKPL